MFIDFFAKVVTNVTDRTRRPLGDYYQLLIRHDLLTEDTPVSIDLTRPVALVSCDSQIVIPETLFVCKGAHFKPIQMKVGENR